ncbi:hypothetical protein ABZ825_20035 [Streptomyces tauricus]
MRTRGCQPTQSTSRQSCDGAVADGEGLAGDVPESGPPVPPDPLGSSVAAGVDGCGEDDDEDEAEEEAGEEAEDEADEEAEDALRDRWSDADAVPGAGSASGRDPCGAAEDGATAPRSADRPLAGDRGDVAVEDRWVSGRVDEGRVYSGTSSTAEPAPVCVFVPRPAVSGADAASARSAGSRSMAVKVRPPPTSATAVATTARRWFFFQRMR